MKKTLYYVVPCYNEEEVLPQTSACLFKKLCSLIEKGKADENSRILFVDDGSKDRTWELIEELARTDCHFNGLKLSRNRGHQNALLAGLMEAKDHCDMAISLDADLQDDVDASERMIDEFEGGSDIVYGVRSARDKDTFFKRNTAQMYYKMMKKLDVELVYNHADYRLMSRRALQELSKFREVNLFLRGMVPLIGFRYSIVTYERAPRAAGSSKYPLKKMLSFAFDGVTSFTTSPIRIITVTGFLVFFISIIMLLYALITKLCGVTTSGWTSIMCSVWLIGGLLLFSVGIIGEYIGKLYSEVKARPRYIIEKKAGKENK